ncbi:MAG: phytanoyl-CoA dioxygenase family protein [Candidatus Poribacteria bacterium]|nr:phytanoyl-CoA dioxygenase family protein [Candidatus Poribacteria bacterium]
MLSTAQIEQFEEEGYLLLSDLISKETIEKAEKAMWHTMGMDADDPNSWEIVQRPFLTNFYIENMAHEKRIELFGVTNPDLLECCTPDYLTVLKQLAERYPSIPHCKSEYPDAIWAMNQFPISAEWKITSPHLDGYSRDLRLDPGTFRASSLTYLTHANSHQGTTVIWPEGPKRIREFRKQNPNLSNNVQTMLTQLPQIDLGEPMEVVAKQGDVLFFHHLLPHTGTINADSSPRFAIRYMCLCLECRPWQKRGEWNIWMP